MPTPLSHTPSSCPTASPSTPVAKPMTLTPVTDGPASHTSRTSPPCGPSPNRTTRIYSRTRASIICALMFFCLVALLAPAVSRALPRGDERPTPAQVGHLLCRGMMAIGLPPTHFLPAGYQPSETLPSSEETRDIPLTDHTQVPPSPEDTSESTDGTTSADSADSADTVEEASLPSPDTSDTTFLDTTSDATAATPETRLPEPTTEAPPPDTTENAPLPSPPVPLRDVSESPRGPSYLWNESTRDPMIPSDAWCWSGGPWYGKDAPDGVSSHAPVILLLSSHPYENYIDGGNVAELTSLLAEALRANGVRVLLIHSGVSGLTPEDSLTYAYERTQALAAYYCRLYNDISLVIDVRRSGEMVSEDTLLATRGPSLPASSSGESSAEPCVQVRAIVDALRPGTLRQTQADLCFAMTLRQRLWKISPTLSRPVYWRASRGLLPCASGNQNQADALLLTLEVGAAGDTFSRASQTLPYLAQALSDMFKCEPATPHDAHTPDA